MAWWIWIIVGAILLAAEAVITADFYLVFFGLAGLLVGLLGVCGLHLPAWTQWLLFAVLAVAGLVLYRGPLKRKLAKVDRAMGPELIGEIASAQAPIPAGAHGRVDLRGTAWDARNDGDDDLAAGARCRVKGVDGLTLLVRAE
ncbi:MAG: NfeD family protein [bacterium]|nr:NfeD family protein [bacterium]